MRETENKAVKYVKYIIFQKISAKDNENQEVSELTFKPNFCTLWLVSVITSCCLMECLLRVESGSDMSIRSHSLNDKRRRFIFMSGLMKALSFYSHLLWGTLGTFNASQRKS